MNHLKTNVDVVVEGIYQKHGYPPNGRLSKFQFSKIFKEISKMSRGHYASKNQIQTIFGLIDQNGDQTISVREFLNLMDGVLCLLEKNEPENYRKVLEYYRVEKGI